MNTGRERVTGKIVTAGAAAKSPNRQFVCPICAAPLFYHPISYHRIAYFGHRPHQAEPNCPLYFAPHDTDVERVVSNRAFRVREPALRLQLLSRQTNGHRWQACILIPKFERATSFSIENSSLHGRVNVSSLKEGGNSFQVNVQCDDYVVTTYEEDESPEIISIEGFSTLTLFRLSSQLCSRLEVRKPLTPGDAYVVIHRGSARPTPPSGLLQTVALIPTDGWFGFAFVLPSSLTSDIENWVSTQLNRSVAEEACVASVISPRDAYCLDDDTWIVSSSIKSLTACFAFGSSDTPPAALNIVHSTGKSQIVRLDASRHASLKIRDPLSGLYQVKHADSDTILLTVVVAVSTRKPEPAGICFLFDVNGRVEKECLWSSELVPRLQGLSVGLAELIEISIPPQVHVSISTGSGIRQQRRLIQSGESFEQGEKAGSKLKEIIELELKNPRPVFEIDAGGFGKVAFSHELLTGLQTDIELPSSLAGRAAWLALVKSRFQDVGRGPTRPGRIVPEFRAHVRQLSSRQEGTRS